MENVTDEQRGTYRLSHDLVTYLTETEMCSLSVRLKIDDK